VKLTFENAWYISQSNNHDFLLITFVDPHLFVGVDGQAIEKEYRKILRKIPTQLTDE